jgi:GTP cyclohydrolase III
MNLSVNNYPSAVKHIDFSKLPEEMKMVHDKWSQFSKFYKKSDKITEMIDNHLKSLTPYMKGDKKVALKKEVSSNSQQKSKPQKTKAVAKKKVVKKVTVSKKKTVKTPRIASKQKQAIRKQNEVPVMPLEVKFIKRYLSLHDKRVTEKQISLFYKTIQKSALEKRIRKSDKYSAEIMKISKDLAQTYKEMNNSCKFEVPSSLYNKLKKISDSYGVTPAIALIKRFVNLYGNITKEKATRLLKSISNAKKNGKVTSSDRAYKRLNEVKGHLEKYLDSDKLIVTDIQLNGLRGIAGLGK